MDLLPFIGIVIGVTHWLRTSLETARRIPEWDTVLSKVWLGSFIFFGLSNIPALSFIGDWYGKIIFLLFLITVYFLKEYRPARMLLLALLPHGIVYCITFVFKLLAPSFYETYSGFFITAEGFTFFWLIGFGIYALVQSSKERKLRIKQEEEARLAEARKAELEQMVNDRTTELTQEKEKLELTVGKLKAAQAQLVQSEKLASLGELTAGIAHEIQNPLNFVNNFAELSVELADELKEEIGKLEIPEKDKDYVAEILGDLTSNQQKINHHGKRAASIVTGMLQHARTSTGTKEPTDLNALADEYLRLSYHGLRAKDSTFNAKMVTDLDPAIGKMEVVPQDIGRVFLNLINNAFYATQQRKRHAPESYEPTVSISSKKENGQVVFKIKDNGTGIPDEVKAKIFQPFFTTKPTGQGTGLGLSLSYDIVVKGHGGNLKVESSEGQGPSAEQAGTEFTIILPIQATN